MTDLPNSFPRICCQCGRDYGQAAVPNSHGYCPVCYKRALAEIERRHVENIRYFVRLCKKHDWNYRLYHGYENSRTADEIRLLQKSLDIDARTHRIIERALNKYSPWRKIRNAIEKKGQSL